MWACTQEAPNPTLQMRLAAVKEPYLPSLPYMHQEQLMNITNGATNFLALTIWLKGYAGRNVGFAPNMNGEATRTGLRTLLRDEQIGMTYK